MMKFAGRNFLKASKPQTQFNSAPLSRPSFIKSQFQFSGSLVSQNVRRNLNTATFQTEKYTKDDQINKKSPFYLNSNLLLLIGASLGLYLLSDTSAEEQKQEENEEKKIEAGNVIEGLKDYTLEDISKHNTIETRIWVTFRDGVYDITEFIEQHPGGTEKILLAAGKAIDPYWNIYAVHKNVEIFEILESYRIGNVAVEDRGKTTAQISASEGPYVNDPLRSPILEVLTATPFNAEAPSTLLAGNYITQNDLFYVRNHLPVPLVHIEDEDDYKIEITFSKKQFQRADLTSENNNEDEAPTVIISLKELKSKFKNHKIAATLQCSGNRRAELSQVKDVLGLAWKSTAISNAEWTGIKLYDLLVYAGINPEINGDYLHIHFNGLDKDITGNNYGASVPLNLALNPNSDILLAFEMNGEELPRDHGYPLRMIVPGITGARNVKWLNSIVISDEESTSHWQKKDYKIFPSNVTPATANWNEVDPLQDVPVQSAILSPANKSSIHYKSSESKDGNITVPLKGFAWSGGGRGIARVEVSTDGVNWKLAEFADDQEKQPYGKAWAWTLWETEVELPAGQTSATLYCRAVDTSGNHQPHSLETTWNFRGLGNNAWNKINVGIVKDDH